MNNLDIINYRKKVNITQKELADKIGVSERTVQNWEAGKVIPKTKCELLRNLLKNPPEKKYEEAVQVNPHIKYIPIVSQYAYGGYLGGFDDPGYMESLPTQPFMIDIELKGNYVVFEVKGDSMDNDSNESLREGDLLLSREVRSEYWKYKLHINKWNFVIVHKTEGILIKKIIDHDVENGIITLHSLSPLYEDRKLSLNDVAQLFNVVQIQRKV